MSNKTVRVVAEAMVRDLQYKHARYPDFILSVTAALSEAAERERILWDCVQQAANGSGYAPDEIPYSVISAREAMAKVTKMRGGG